MYLVVGWRLNFQWPACIDNEESKRSLAEPTKQSKVSTLTFVHPLDLILITLDASTEGQLISADVICLPKTVETWDRPYTTERSSFQKRLRRQ